MNELFERKGSEMDLFCVKKINYTASGRGNNAHVGTTAVAVIMFSVAEKKPYVIFVHFIILII